MGHYSSFILRLWVEPPDGLRWGVIQHVTSRESLRFQVDADNSLPGVLDFIRRHSIESELALPFALDLGEVSAPPPDGTGIERHAEAEAGEGESKRGRRQMRPHEERETRA